MIVIFSSVTIDPRRRPELDQEMEAWMSETASSRDAAEIYKYMVDPADPSKTYSFQFWPDDTAFAT